MWSRSSRSRARGYGRWDTFAQPTVAEQQRRATAAVARLGKKGDALDPVRPIAGAIAKTFWGKAWCSHLEALGDYSNRLPRGRSYVRHGAVVDLQISEGKVQARVQGSSLYRIEITIRPVAPARWKKLVDGCSGSIETIFDLMSGSLPKPVIAKVTDPRDGMFPASSEISFACSCPDWASMCKHVAATLYGVGARLDERPELLFVLRGADHRALVSEASARVIDQATAAPVTAKLLDVDALSDVFGIALDGLDRATVRAPVPQPTVAPIVPAGAAAKPTKRTARETAATTKRTAKKSAASSARAPAKKKAASTEPPAKIGTRRAARKSSGFDALGDMLRDSLRAAFTR